MTILSSFFKGSEKRVEQKSPGMMAAERAESLWARERTGYSFCEIMTHAEGEQRHDAPRRFLFTAGDHLAKKAEMSNRYLMERTAKELWSVREILRASLGEKPGAIQQGILRNIEVWNLYASEPWKAPNDIFRLLCFARIRSIAELFPDLIDTAVIEVTIAFVLRAMARPAVLRDREHFVTALALADALATRRPENKLTREELSRLRDDIVFDSVPMALILQERIEAL